MASAADNVENDDRRSRLLEVHADGVDFDLVTKSPGFGEND